MTAGEPFADFAARGWFRFPLKRRDLLDALRSSILERLQGKVPEIDSLERYHEFVESDEEHFALQKHVSDWYWESGLGPELLVHDVDVFRKFMGLDLHIQARPYLRIARPGKPQDNVSVHRDTHYGGSPFEVSVHIPFTDTGLDGSLGVISGSHIEPDSAYPYDMIENPGVSRGDTMHQMGFLYAPKRMRDEDIARVTPAGTRLGEALVFSLALVHGQVVNRSSVTRFSTDIRMINSLAPVDWARFEARDRYKKISVSPMTEAARLYEAAEAADAARGETRTDTVHRRTPSRP
jgi:Phytanoyl-CoA dioxygenase (PhyH)